MADTSGNYVATSTFGSFTVNLDTAATTVSAFSAPNVTAAGGTTETFTVTYADNVAVNVSSLDSNDVRVTGPNGYNQPATLLSVDNSGNGTPRTATYQMAGPGGGWDLLDNGRTPDCPVGPGGRHERKLRGHDHLRFV